MKIGDYVRFLSEAGGGRIAGFQGKNIALVEDEDGFQIPTALSDLIVVNSDDYDIGKVHTVTPPTAQPPVQQPTPKPADKMMTAKPTVEERRGGDVLNLYLAFVPIDIKEITNTRFECYFVNDSNYYIHFSYLMAEGNSWSLHTTMELEPNTKEFINEFGREELGAMEHVAVQAIAYKRDKTFLLKPSIDVQLRIDTVKFYKLHTFRENDFFEQPALLYPIIENDKPAQPLVADARKIKESLYKRPASGKDDDYARRYDDKRKKGNPFIIRRKGDEDVIIKDLHASALLDTTTGMSASDILHYQVDTFRKTMEQYRSKRGQRIIFIHGKGEGVLRQAIVHELNYRYKNCPYQDASFQEYGYGATQVTIK